VRKITVVQVIPRMRSGGAELGCLQVAEALVNAGNRAIVVSAGGRMVEQLRAVGAEHIEMPLAAKNPISLALNARRLARLVKTEGVDILHARSRAPAWSTFAAARRTDAAFVTTYHSEYSERGRVKNLYNSVMARSDTVIAVSHYMAKLIRERYRTPEERIAVIPRAFDPAKFDVSQVTPERIADVRAQFGAGPDDKIALLAGRITRRKAQDHFVEALGILKQQGHAVPLAVLAGEVEKDDFKAELLARAAALGVADRIRIPGFVGDMAAAYTASHVLLNISAFEGLPRVALEAQAMSCPVIVSDTGPGREVALTPPDTPREAATGLRVPFADPPKLAAALAELLSDEAARQAMGARAARHVRATYTLAGLTSSTLKVYETVLTRRGKL
jgi:glycosyltransferase involved in cell wall biosynthesis